MNECPVCGDDSVDEVDGYFFCATCQTQSQYMRHEETPEFFTTRGLSLRSRRQNVKSTSIKTDHGRPWEITEAFTVILKAQVEALLKVGVNPKLNDVVFKIWSIYLSRTGSAFNTSQEDTVLLSMLADMKPRDRDLRPATVKDPTIQPIHMLKTRSRARPAGSTGAEIHKQQLEETLGSEEFYEEDNPLLSEKDEADLDEYDELGNTRGDMYGQCNEELLRSISRLSLRSLISILHIGLLYCHNTVTSSDLCRWIKRGVIPYINTKGIIPDNMTFSGSDSCMFSNATTPTPSSILSGSAQLTEFIDRKHFPLIDLRELTSKYILQLALPGELQALVTSLVNRVGPLLDVSRTSSKMPFTMQAPEHVAMATVVILLKMLFVLDDDLVWEISRYARKVNLACPSLRLFILKDWILSRSHKTGLTKLPRSTREVLKIKDATNCTAAHKKLCEGMRYSKNRGSYDRFLRTDVRDKLRKPFTILSATLQPKTKLASQGNDNLQEPQFQDPSEEMMDLNATFDFEASLQECEDAGCSNVEEEDFWKSTVKYITEGHAFKKFLRREMQIVPATSNNQMFWSKIEAMDEVPIMPETLDDEPLVPETLDEVLVNRETLDKVPILQETSDEVLVVPETLDENLVVPDTLDEVPVIPETLDEVPVISETLDEVPVIPETLDEIPVISETLDEVPVISETLDEVLVVPETLNDSYTSFEVQDSQIIASSQPWSKTQCATSKDSAGYWQVDAVTFNELLCLPHAGCSPYILESKRRGALSSSYQDCLNICSGLIECSPKDLLAWIKRLEIKLFSKALRNTNGERLPVAELDAEYLKHLVMS